MSGLEKASTHLNKSFFPFLLLKNSPHLREEVDFATCCGILRSMRHAPCSALLFRPGGLGDLLVVLPSVRLIRGCLPDHRLVLVCREAYGKLLEETNVVDALISWNDRKVAGLFYEAEDSGLRTEWLRDYSILAGWMMGMQGAYLETRCRGLGMDQCYFVGPPENSAESLSRHYFEGTKALLRGFLPGNGREWSAFEECARLPINDGMRKESLRFFGMDHGGEAPEFAIIHPGSGSVRKRWPLANFLEVTREWSDRGLRGILVTGEAEEDLAEELARVSLPAGWRLFSAPPLRELAALLTACSIYLGNDSGVTHLAAACGCRVLSLFRRDLFALWKPYGNARVLAEDDVSVIKIDRVLNTASKILDRK